MAWVLEDRGIPFTAASQISEMTPVTIDTTQDGGIDGRFVIPVTSTATEPFGIAKDIASQGLGVKVIDQGQVTKAVAAASLGYGSEVGIASTNGALGPLTGASGSVKWSVGKALSTAAAGEVFSVYVRPRQLSGLV